MAQYIYSICRFIVIIFLALLPLAAQSNNLFDFQLSLAKSGDAEAQFNVGEMYEIGFGVKQNKKEARYWITRSANQKYEKGEFKLLYWDVERDGLEGNNKVKVKELNMRANQGNAQAQYYLGKMYAHGVGIDKNSDVAFDWLNKAASAGVLEAELDLTSVREEKQYEEQQKALLKKRFESDLCSSNSARFLSTCR